MTEPFEIFDTPFGEPSVPLFDAPVEQPMAGEGLVGRLAVVTGASGLLGGSIATELSARGAAVCLLGKDQAALDATVSSLGSAARCASLRCDLAVADDVAKAVMFVERLDRPVDLLVHAAGLQAPGRVVDGPVDELDKHYLLNVRGPYVLSQLTVPLMRRPGGQCVFVTSSEGSALLEGDAHHTITQAAVRALADQLRLETAHQGIRVLTIVTDGGTGGPRSAVDPAEFAAALAAGVADALLQSDLHVTEMTVRGIARPVRTEQR